MTIPMPAALMQVMFSEYG